MQHFENKSNGSLDQSKTFFANTLLLSSRALCREYGAIWGKASVLLGRDRRR